MAPSLLLRSSIFVGPQVRPLRRAIPAESAADRKQAHLYQIGRLAGPWDSTRAERRECELPPSLMGFSLSVGSTVMCNSTLMSA